MSKIRIDIPVFFSESQAFGYASGDLEVSTLPVPESEFSWPASWSTAFPRHFNAENSKVWYVEPWSLTDATHLVGLFGVSCTDVYEAKQVADFLASVPGFRFSEHERPT